MEIVESPYYAEIRILGDGWPWNLAEFDFRRFFAPGCCPSALIPVAALGFLRSGRFSHRCALGLTLGGLLGTLCAFPLVNLVAEHLTLMRWLVIVVIVYAAVSMLRSSRASVPKSPDAEIEFHP